MVVTTIGVDLTMKMHSGDEKEEREDDEEAAPGDAEDERR